MSTQELRVTEAFQVRQKITMMVNRYEILAEGPGGSDGPLLAFAQQKRMAFKEEVTFYTDESRSVPIFSFKARQRMDLGATYDVFDPEGRSIGSFRKDFGKSLLRSTWHLTTPTVQAVGQERSLPAAALRRVWELIPIISAIPCLVLFHFDFTDGTGRVVLSSRRRRSLRDRYEVKVPGGLVDGRVAASMAVALDALQGR
jgi:uncharacterized protein YxjI